jgi:hypothetical protein
VGILASDMAYGVVRQGFDPYLVLANADLAKPLTLLGRPSLEGLVRESYFC